MFNHALLIELYREDASPVKSSHLEYLRMDLLFWCVCDCWVWSIPLHAQEQMSAVRWNERGGWNSQALILRGAIAWPLLRSQAIARIVCACNCGQAINSHVDWKYSQGHNQLSKRLSHHMTMLHIQTTLVSCSVPVQLALSTDFSESKRWAHMQKKGLTMYLLGPPMHSTAGILQLDAGLLATCNHQSWPPVNQRSYWEHSTWSFDTGVWTPWRKFLYVQLPSYIMIGNLSGSSL